MDMKELWTQIVELQETVKDLVIWAEENNVDKLETFIQPIKEQRDALTHLCRAKAAELGLKEGEGDFTGYIQRNLDKALGHLYRAFFDAADFLCIILRERYYKTLSPYDAECISTVMPEYYQQISPRMESLTKAVSDHRSGKDVSKGAIMQTVQKYRETIKDILGLYKTVIEKVPALEDYRQRKKRAEKKDWKKQVILLLIGTGLGIIGSYLVPWIISLLSSTSGNP
jgi:hypothetical protein